MRLRDIPRALAIRTVPTGQRRFTPHMKLSLLTLLLVPLLHAQQLQPVTSVQPDCQKFITPIIIAGTFVSATVDNRQAACDGWTVTYSSFGFGTVSVLLQDAPLTTAGVAGTFVSYAGTIVTGFTNPATATTSAEIRAGGATAAEYYPYVRVQITTTGAGILFAEFHGFKSNTNAGGSGSGGCPGTVGTPCVVVGPEAVGANSTKSPVQMGGQDINTAAVTKIQTDSGGGVMLGDSGAPPQGNGTLTGQFSMIGVGDGILFGGTIQTIPYQFNGTSWDRPYYCTNRANIALTTIGLTRIITGSAAKKIHLCSLSMSFASPVDVQVVEGTKVATDCDTGATNMSGLYRSVVGFDPNLSNLFALTQATNADDVCISMSASVNGGGTAIYAVF